MTNVKDLTDRSAHFEFGENWASYSELIDEPRVQSAIASVRLLVPDLAGKSFLDIGSGSGLFSLAALKLGAARVSAVDIDENSVATTRATLSAQAAGSDWTAERGSVFDLHPERHGLFDVVYSWGVLHHTGDMWRAIESASHMVKPGGVFAFALYEKTPLCGFWKVEKKFYMRAGESTQRLIRSAYLGAYRLGLRLKGKNPDERFADATQRGMDVVHDAHDWLGGYPYESTNKAEVATFMRKQGFTPVLEKPVPIHAGGILGCGCSEYVYRRQ